MASPERPGEPREKRSLLGLVAYVLVPGERRRKAAGHFRRAGFEVLRGVGALARPEKPPDGGETGRWERIDIE